MIRTQFTALSNDEIITRAPAAGALMPHQDVSEKYDFVSTLQTIDLLKSVGWQPVEAKQSKVRLENKDGFQRHMIRFAMPELTFSSDERVDLVLYNSHDRGCAFNLIASIWRKICGNGLMVSSDLFNFSHKHIGFDGEAFVKSAFQIAEGSAEIAEQVNDMKLIELSPDERGVFARAAHGLVYDEPDEAPIRPERLLRERRYDDLGKDLWTTFNVIQENLIRGGLRGRKRGSNGRMRNATTRPVKAIDRDVKLNKALWTLTEGMAELKKAA